VLDTDSRIRWLNEAAKELLGDVVGRYANSLVAPEHDQRAREAFTSKLLGTSVTNFEVNVIGRGGSRLKAQITSARLEDDGRSIGVFGIIRDVRLPKEEATPEGIELTARQHEVLVLLSLGRSSEQIAEELELSIETVRNHVREILRRLDVHSRLAAVAAARRYGLL
jgi:two-component system, NarL family, nitrate/nitrite response regulator NarL